MNLRERFQFWWRGYVQLELPGCTEIKHHCTFAYDDEFTRMMHEPYQPYYTCRGCGAVFIPPNR